MQKCVRLRIWLLAVVAAALVPSFVAAKEPANLYLLKREIRTYVETGEYDRDIAAVAAEARDWLQAHAPKPGAKTAIVFDIDETLLSNLAHMQKMDYGYVPAEWNVWVGEGNAPAIKPVAELYQLARKLGVSIFIMSGRREQERRATEQNLRDAGLDGYTGIFFKPDGQSGTTESFKTATRKKITEDGYTILLNIGDQQSDLNGGYAEITFKLPNPFYITR